jgi:uncharacterized protein (TIGR02271 family)
MNTNNQTAVAGYFEDRSSAERAVQDLMEGGFTEAEIDLAPYRSPAAGQYAGTSPYLDSSSYFNRRMASSGTMSPTMTDSAAGMAAAPGGAYQDIAGGGMLVTVTGPRASEARRILERAGADLSDRVNPGLADEGVQRIQLREEQLRARKQTVQAGEVRVGKEVVTETQSIDVPVSHDELVIERHPVQAGTAAQGTIGQDSQDIRVPLNREEVTLQKQAVVREEVEVGKRSVTETQHLSDTVRHEEARIENTGDVHVETGTGHEAEMLDEDEAYDSGTRPVSR